MTPLRLTLVALWDDMVNSEIGDPPDKVAEWADYHMNRFIAFREVARVKRDRDHVGIAFEVIRVLRHIFDHHHSQVELESRIKLLTGRTRENAADKLATLKAKNERVRKPMSWLHTKISTARAAASKFV